MNLHPASTALQRRDALDHLHRLPPRPTTLRARLFVSSLIVDAFCLILGFTAAAVLHGQSSSLKQVEVILAAMLPVYLVTGLNVGAYDPELIEDRLRSISRGLRSLLITFGILLLAGFSLKTSAIFSRFTLVLGACFSIGLLSVGRYLFARNAKWIIGGNPFSVVTICDGDVRQPVSAGSTVVMADAAGFDPESHDPGMYDRLARALGGVNRVVVVCGAERRQAWAGLLKGANVQADVVVPEFTSFAPLGVSRHGGDVTLIVSAGPLALTDRLIKRAFDTSVAGFALLFFLPLLALVAIAIKLDSKGPVFFRQTRIGRGNAMFEVLKFRSMRVEDCDGHGHRSTARGDDRITRVGRAIRMTSIDELPQLINVLKGDMSIVGPRPHALGSRAADKLFWEIDSRYWHRHAAKPGLTGLAQIRGYRGATVHEHDLVNRLQADLEYLDGWSLWRDMVIIAKTFRVLFHRNAY
ncbi:MAG: exopolysaccharide biosynthesis polyprenyl glycosylphosphotransferase [Sphingomonas sp.]